MKKAAIFASILITLLPAFAFATPTSVDRITDHIQPLISTDFVRGTYFTAFSTNNHSTLPYASSTAVSAAAFCLTGNLPCITSWPSTTPGGSDTQVQFNDSNAFGGDSALVWNKTTNVLTIGTDLEIRNPKPGTISNIGIGSNTLTAITTAEENVIVGPGAGVALTTGSTNVAIGSGALGAETTSGADIAIGGAALDALTTGGHDVGLGLDAGGNVTDSSDSFYLGDSSGRDSSGNENIFIGSAAGLQTGNAVGHTVAIGASAGRNNLGSGGVFLGWNAGQDAVGDNKLVIANSNTPSPLVYGEFDNALFGTNGSLFALGPFTVGTTSTTTIQGNATSTFNGGVNIPTGKGCFAIGATCLSFLSSYDAFTHPATGQSATTSLLLLNGNASSTLFSSFGPTYFGRTATTTITGTGAIGIGTTTPWALLSVSADAGLAPLAVGSSTRTILKVDSSGNIVTSGRTPTLGTCGTASISATSSDMRGAITISAGTPTTCNITFSSAKPDTPACIASTNSVTLLSDIAAASSSGVQFGLSAAFSGTITYICLL